MKYLFFICAFIFAVPAFAEEPRTLDWEELLPEGELELLDKLYASQVPGGGDHSLFGGQAFGGPPVQVGTFNVVDDLDGQLVRIPGFVLPFEYSKTGKLSEFLLVPYFGACIHTPPPPPNQMVYVTATEPTDLGQQWDAIWAVGILRTKQNINDLGDAAYTLEIQRWEKYDG